MKRSEYCLSFVALIIVLAIIILWGLIFTCKEQFSETVTKIMEDIDEVPTIELVEKAPEKNLIQKILGNVNQQRISFNIKQKRKNYSIEISSFEDYNFAGKGLVIAASGTRYRYLTGLFTNLWTIRKYHKSNIPVEIFYVGKKEEFEPNIKKAIMDLGNVKIINILDCLDTNVKEEELRGYQTKPLAALCSSFEEIIIMDADGLSFVDPYYFFDIEGYEEFGMVLFRDYVDCLSYISKDFIENIGIGVDKYCKKTMGFEIDSSCVVMNKERMWDTLYTICIINVKSDSYYKTTKNVLGDKDTWLIGAMFMNFEPFISRPDPSIVITDFGKQISGHLQSTTFIDSMGSSTIPLYYNNQMVDLRTANVDNWKYIKTKNPAAGASLNRTTGGTGFSQKMIETFKYAKNGMRALDEITEIKNKIRSTRGISHGFIP
jgi:hypothetical protein